MVLNSDFRAVVYYSDTLSTFQPLAPVKLIRHHRRNLIKGKWSKEDIVKYIRPVLPLDFNPAFRINNESLKVSLKTFISNIITSHRVDDNEIKVGDHIYTWRDAYIFSHHGIYIGENMVIHVNPVVSGISGSKTGIPKHCAYPGCGYWAHTTVFRTCLSCFKDNRPLCRYKYGVGTFEHMFKLRDGTCTMAPSDPPEQVIKRVKKLFDYGFGNYKLIGTNCEDFGIYCKTSRMVPGKKFFIGTSGQGSWFYASLVAFVVYAFVKASLISMQKYFHKREKKDHITTNNNQGNRRFIRTSFTVILAAVAFFAARHALDIGVRPGAVRVEVGEVIKMYGENVRVKKKVWCPHCNEWR